MQFYTVHRHLFLMTIILTHWGRVTHICVSRLIIPGSDNGLLPGRRQAITWTNAGILLIGPLGTNFSEIEIYRFSFTKMHLKMSSGKWWPFCLGLNVLNSFHAYVASSCKLLALVCTSNVPSLVKCGIFTNADSLNMLNQQWVYMNECY